MSRQSAGMAEIVWRGDDAVAEMMLPKAIDDDAGDLRAGAGFEVGHPVGEGAAATGEFSALGRFKFPALAAFARAHHDLQEILLRHAVFEVGVAAAEDVRFVEKIGALRVHAQWRVTFSANESLGQAGRFCFGVGFQFCGSIFPTFITPLPPVEKRFAIFVGYFGRVGEKRGDLWSNNFAFERRVGVGNDRQAGAANVVARVQTELELHGYFGAGGDWIGERKYGGVIFSELGIDRPAGVWFVIKRRGDGKIICVLLERGGGLLDFHFVRTNKNAQAAESNVAVIGAARPAFWH